MFAPVGRLGARVAVSVALLAFPNMRGSYRRDDATNRIFFSDIKTSDRPYVNISGLRLPHLCPPSFPVVTVDHIAIDLRDL